MKHSSVCICNCDYCLCLQVLIFACFYQHGKVISREELEEILAKEKTEEVEVKCKLHCSILFFTEFLAFYLSFLCKVFFKKKFNRSFLRFFFISLFFNNWALDNYFLFGSYCLPEPCPGRPQLKTVSFGHFWILACWAQLVQKG